jgi:hypothetical protein
MTPHVKSLGRLFSGFLTLAGGGDNPAAATANGDWFFWAY